MDAKDEYDFYSKPDNQEPQGPPTRRRRPLTEVVPVRFSDDVLSEIRRRAEVDDRSVSAWVRRAVEHELDRERSAS